jgi:hypothetical protein
MRRICVALALVTLAGCGGADSARQATGAKSAPPPAPPSDGAPPLAGGGGGIEAAPAIDSVAIRLSKVCRAVQTKLEDAPETTGPEVAAANAEKERRVLAALEKKLAAFKIDPQRRAALLRYRAILGHEIAVDELIVTAGNAEDRAAVDDLNEQNGHNRRKRRELADEALAAKGCRPGTRITD